MGAFAYHQAAFSCTDQTPPGVAYVTGLDAVDPLFFGDLTSTVQKALDLK